MNETPIEWRPGELQGYVNAKPTPRAVQAHRAPTPTMKRAGWLARLAGWLLGGAKYIGRYSLEQYRQTLTKRPDEHQVTNASEMTTKADKTRNEASNRENYRF